MLAQNRLLLLLYYELLCVSLGTEFVVVEDSSCLDTHAIILKGTMVLTYKPRLLDRPFSGSLAGMEVTSLLLRLLVLLFNFLKFKPSTGHHVYEPPTTSTLVSQVFSCRLGSEQETALSIIDPVNIQVELCGSPTYQSSSGLLDAFNVEDIPPLLEVRSSARRVRGSTWIWFPMLSQ